MANNRWLYQKRCRRLYGDSIQQTHVALWFYEQIIHQHWTEWIIEIGIGCAASSAYFATLAFCKGIPYLGIDDFNGDYEPPVYNRERNLEVEDSFSVMAVTSRGRLWNWLPCVVRAVL